MHEFACFELQIHMKMYVGNANGKYLEKPLKWDIIFRVYFSISLRLWYLNASATVTQQLQFTCRAKKKHKTTQFSFKSDFPYRSTTVVQSHLYSMDLAKSRGDFTKEERGGGELTWHRGAELIQTSRECQRCEIDMLAVARPVHLRLVFDESASSPCWSKENSTISIRKVT